VWRLDLRLRYENWRAIHDLLAIAAAGLVLYHMFKVNFHMAYPLQRAYWIFSIIIWASATIYIRIIRPLHMIRHPYSVVLIKPERNDAWSLTLQPEGHKGFDFMAGQFAWIAVRKSPFSFHDNPFSFSSSSEDKKQIQFTIKNLGDFTSTIDQLQPGEKVYVDGPYGTFDIDQHDAQGYVMIAGGIGAVPVMSILRTMADRKDPRPVIFFACNKDWESVTYREGYDDLVLQMNLKLVHVLSNPSDDWQGEKGYINAEILDKYLGDDRKDLHYFICGPIPMISAVEKDLKHLGIPLDKIHTENYEMA